MNGNKKTKFKQGRLGIGTDDPKYPLDIIGDIRLTGCIRDASGNPLPLSHSSYKDLSNSNLIIWNKNSPTVPGVNIFIQVGTMHMPSMHTCALVHFPNRSRLS